MKLKLIIFGVLVCTKIFSQSLYLVPYFGVSYSKSNYTLTSPNVYGSFKNTTKLNGLYGLGLEFVKNKNTYGIGYKSSAPTLISKFTIDSKLTQNKDFYNLVGPGFVNRMHNFAFSYSRYILTIYKSKKDLDGTPIRKIDFLGALSINLSKNKNAGGASPYSDDTTGNEIFRVSYKSDYKRNIKYSLTTDIGLRVQFYKYDKQGLAFNLWYSRGFIKRAFYNYEASFTNSDGTYLTTADFFTRGSYVGMALSCPILLWSKKEISK